MWEKPDDLTSSLDFMGQRLGNSAVLVFFCYNCFMLKTMNLIILGPQGSGKGTQAELLAKKFNLINLGAGELLREIAKTDTPLGHELHQIINVEGKHARPEIVTQVFMEKLKNISKEKGVILESYPRNLDQYKKLLEFWPKLDRGDLTVIFIDLAEEEAVIRLSDRLVCEKCGSVFIAGTTGDCRKCGGKLGHRVDDKPDTIRQRLKLFRELTLPMVQEMEKTTKVIRIDGAPSIDTVHKQILKSLPVI